MSTSTDTLENLGKAFPAGPRIGIDRAVPRDSYTAQRTVIRVKAAGTIGYPTPWSVTRHRMGGKVYYQAEWLDTRNRAWFLTKRDAADFLDLHRYAEGVRRITGELPAWAVAATDSGI
jgi:hypothetical protein